jgi:hypothetical protein
MKYLKLFENMDKLYKQIRATEYIDYFKEYRLDYSYISIIEKIARQCLSDKITNILLEDGHPYIQLILNRTYIDNSRIYKIHITLLNEEYIIISLSFGNTHDRFYICDTREGFEQFLKEVVIK